MRGQAFDGIDHRNGGAAGRGRGGGRGNCRGCGNGDGPGSQGSGKGDVQAGERLRELISQGCQRVVVAVDDTDDLTKATSTGKIARLIANEVSTIGGLVVLDVSRHQLLIRKDVPYTSHNSAMAFEALVPPENVGFMRGIAIDVIAANRAETSDPGLCVAQVPKAVDLRDVPDAVALMEFGRLAKEEFIPIRDAYALADRIDWVELSEHGGDGSGVVGALAAIGLRLSGDDGRFRGRWNLERRWPDLQDARVLDVRSRLAFELAGSARVVDATGVDLPDEMPVQLVSEAKPILSGGAFALVCDVVDGVAVPCAKVDLGDIGNGSWDRVCAMFVRDNDDGECQDEKRSCRNCLYRRWVARGFVCVRGEKAE
ncbi:MAG: hypothetical protein J5818_00605 [Eggerthellaceae bacterium]|nr:hypothetical protein [Eggerthellaceae bacterium]